MERYGTLRAVPSAPDNVPVGDVVEGAAAPPAGDDGWVEVILHAMRGGGDHFLQQDVLHDAFADGAVARDYGVAAWQQLGKGVPAGSAGRANLVDLSARLYDALAGEVAAARLDPPALLDVCQGRGGAPSTRGCVRL